MARLFVVVLLLLPLGTVLGACARENAPPLVEVSEVSPREVEVGDRLEIRGAGFPQGRRAHVALRGAVHRPGELPSSVALDLEGLVTSPERVEVAVDEALVERLCDRGERAGHATFTGELEVAFSSNTPGAPPLVGSLHGVTLDARASEVAAHVQNARESEGSRVLAFLGLTTSPSNARGLPIEKVAPDSPAARAGISPGDVLTAVDGANVSQIADVRPVSARQIDVAIRHPESPEDDVKTLSLVGYAGDRVPIEYAPALVVVALGLALLLLIALPSPPAVARLELAVAARLRGLRAKDVAARLLGDTRSAACLGLLTALLAMFALGPHVVGPDIDGLVLLAASIALFLGARARAARGIRETCAFVLASGTPLVVLACTVAVAVAADGAIAPAEIVRAQGILPWDLVSLRSPVGALLAVVYFGATVSLLRLARRDRRGGFLGQAAVLVASCLAAILFFGGWSVGDHRGGGWSIVGALLLVTKSWAIAMGIIATARIASPLTPATARRLVLRRLLPALLVAVGLAFALRHVATNSAVQVAFGSTVAALVVMLAARSFARVRGVLGRPAPHASPFA